MLSQGNIRGRYHSACQQQSASVNTLIALHCLSNIYCCGQCLKEVHDKDHVIFYDNDVVGHQITSLEGVELKTNKNCCYYYYYLYHFILLSLLSNNILRGGVSEDK